MRRLIPIRSHRRARFALTWPTIALPIAAMILLSRGESLRAPLGEQEAALAIAAQPARGHLGDLPVNELIGDSTAPTVALESLASRLLTTEEFHLRLPGVLAGCFALGVAIVLGERLFATRIGLAAALLLLLLPAGRTLVGTQLSAEPYYLLAMLGALAAIRDVGESRFSAIVAGVASGLAIAIGGRDGLWLPAFALAWLWLNQGLNLRSFCAVILTAAVVAIGCATAARLWLAHGSTRGLLLPWRMLDPQLGNALPRPAVVARGLLPLLPLAALGVASLPAGWRKNLSLRFVLTWSLFGAANRLLGASLVPLYVAAIYLIAMLSVWGLERAGWRLAIGALGVAAAIAVASASFLPQPSLAGDHPRDRWAVRETGRFLWRTIPAERRIVAEPAVRKRLTYYGRRPIDVASAEPDKLRQADYLVLTNDDFRDLSRAARQQEKQEHGPTTPQTPQGTLRMVAQFGPWVVARVGSNASAGGLDGNSPEPPIEPQPHPGS